MYGIVLATMLATGGSVPNWGWHHGCWGCSGCHGCWSCGGCSGGSGCRGWSCHGCYGCYGGHGGWSSYSCGGCWGCYGGVVIAPVKKEEKKDTTKSALDNAPATVVVQIPADAKLFIDGQLDRQTAEKRTIVTPDLSSDREYYYRLNAEVTQGGRVIRETKRIALRAGHLVEVDFHELNQAVTASR